MISTLHPLHTSANAVLTGNKSSAWFLRFTKACTNIRVSHLKQNKIMRNRESIQVAAQNDSKMAVLVLIAPGFAQQDKEFRGGLGHLLNSIENHVKS
ncbi:MAG: hypothetical protein MZV63_26700 [Marinilabiliales bacterium]|nr:hypothetical protein [Marinilabiliales bacterium]